jgi:hypothetical protein
LAFSGYKAREVDRVQGGERKRKTRGRGGKKNHRTGEERNQGKTGEKKLKPRQKKPRRGEEKIN